MIVRPYHILNMKLLNSDTGTPYGPCADLEGVEGLPSPPGKFFYLNVQSKTIANMPPPANTIFLRPPLEKFLDPRMRPMDNVTHYNVPMVLVHIL